MHKRAVGARGVASFGLRRPSPAAQDAFAAAAAALLYVAFPPPAKDKDGGFKQRKSVRPPPRFLAKGIWITVVTALVFLGDPKQDAKFL